MRSGDGEYVATPGDSRMKIQMAKVFNEGLPPSPSKDFLDEYGSYLLHFLSIDESQPSSSSDGGVTDNAETGNGVSTYQNHKDSDVYAETLKEESASYHGSTESNNLSLKHNLQETSFEYGQYRYLWGPQDWLMHPSLYCKYMERYLYMPLEVDSARPSYGEVNGVDLDLLEIVEHIEYYFSFDNLIHDVNFREHMNYYDGWVPLPFIASLPEPSIVRVTKILRKKSADLEGLSKITAVAAKTFIVFVKTTVFRKTCQNTVNEAIASGSEESRTKERGKQQGHGSG
ncbi:hypothetical protein K1719_005164 [Acacia pycnantha]|nr:hypothetical protein K1719_005164 [Acacia pycnantha]